MADTFDSKQFVAEVVAKIKNNQPVDNDDVLDAFALIAEPEAAKGNIEPFKLFLLGVAGENKAALLKAVEMFFTKDASTETPRSKFRFGGRRDSTDTTTAKTDTGRRAPRS